MEQAEVARLKDGLAARRATNATHALGIVLGAMYRQNCHFAWAFVARSHHFVGTDRQKLSFGRRTWRD